MGRRLRHIGRWVADDEPDLELLVRGERRLLEYPSSSRPGPGCPACAAAAVPQELLRGLVEAVPSFAGETPRSDDLTVLAVSFRGRG